MAKRGVNKVILAGNLGQDPDVKYMPNGDPVANISIATSENWIDKNTGEKVEKTEWHRVVAFRGLAKVWKDYLKKGSKVYIEGKLQTRRWEAADGTPRYTTEVLAEEFQFLSSTNAPNESQPVYQQPAAKKVVGSDVKHGDFDAEDIPF